MIAETDAMWGRVRASLVWQPIAEYDRAKGHLVLLRCYGDETIGYWHEGFWWHAQGSLDGMKIWFDPTMFAEVSDEWRNHLMAD